VTTDGPVVDAVHAARACAVRSDGSLWCWPTLNSAAVRVGTVSTWATVSTGMANNLCALRVDGSLWCWDAPQSPRRILPGTTWRQVSVGDGTVTSAETPVLAPTPLAGTGWTAVSTGGLHACALSGGAVRCWGDGDAGELGFQVAAGGDPVT
jgi:hypothetical protein